jgi:molybdopterin converting factor small subunit
VPTTVLVRYFAGARAAAGVTEDHVEFDTAGPSIAQVLARIRARRGVKLDIVLPACSFLLNGVAVRDQLVTVPDGGELDVLPPFAGG